MEPRATGHTCEVVDREMAAVLRQKSPEERLAIGIGMWKFARRMLRVRLATEHPDWDEQELNLAVAKRLSDGSW